EVVEPSGRGRRGREPETHAAEKGDGEKPFHEMLPHHRSPGRTAPAIFVMEGLRPFSYGTLPDNSAQRRPIPPALPLQRWHERPQDGHNALASHARQSQREMATGGSEFQEKAHDSEGGGETPPRRLLKLPACMPPPHRGRGAPTPDDAISQRPWPPWR